MPKRRTRPSDLGVSWASEDYDADANDHYSDHDKSRELLLVNVPELADQHTPLELTSHLPASASSLRFYTSSVSPNTHLSSVHSPLRQSLRVARPEPHSPEPSFIMPSMNQDAMDASWMRQASMSPSAPRRQTRSSSVRSSQQSPRVSSRESTGLRFRHQESTRFQQVDDTLKYEQEHMWVLPRQLWIYAIQPALAFVFSTFRMTLQIAKPFLAWGLAVWAAYLLAIGMRNNAISSVTSLLSPLCHVPGSSFFYLPFCRPPVGPVEYNKLADVQSSFEEVFEASIQFGALPHVMRDTEHALAMLRSLVKFSTLPSKNEIVFELNAFHDTSRAAANDLISFETNVARAADRVDIMTSWSLLVLEGLKNAEQSQGLVWRHLSKLNPLAPYKTPYEKAFEQYARHILTVDELIHKILEQAKSIERELSFLDDTLVEIGSLAARDGITIEGSKSKLLESLWTRLGGNQSRMRDLDRQNELLRSTRDYQSSAWMHVSATIVTLQIIAAQVKDLKSRMNEPTLKGTQDIPFEIYMKSIELGVERLRTLQGKRKQLHHELRMAFKPKEKKKDSYDTLRDMLPKNKPSALSEATLLRS